MLAIPGATIARSLPARSSAAWAKTSFDPTLSGIHTAGYPSRSYSRIAAPASAAVSRCSANDQIPTRPNLADSARPPMPPMPPIGAKGTGATVGYAAARARSRTAVAAPLSCAHHRLSALVAPRQGPGDLRLIGEWRVPAARMGPRDGREATDHR